MLSRSLKNWNDLLHYTPYSFSRRHHTAQAYCWHSFTSPWHCFCIMLFFNPVKIHLCVFPSWVLKLNTSSSLLYALPQLIFASPFAYSFVVYCCLLVQIQKNPVFSLCKYTEPGVSVIQTLVCGTIHTYIFVPEETEKSEGLDQVRRVCRHF